jgi:hypothetical protein
MSLIKARSRRPTTVDASMLSSRAHLSGIEQRRCSGLTRCRGPAHRLGRVDRHDLAADKSIEQMADRGESLLDARRREFARASLDPGGDVHWLDSADRWHAGGHTPGKEFIGGAARVCGLRMLAAKNSRKRTPARSPAAATSAGYAGIAGRRDRSCFISLCPESRADKFFQSRRSRH